MRPFDVLVIGPNRLPRPGAVVAVHTEGFLVQGQRGGEDEARLGYRDQGRSRCQSITDLDVLHVLRAFDGASNERVNCGRIPLAPSMDKEGRSGLLLGPSRSTLYAVLAVCVKHAKRFPC